MFQHVKPPKITPRNKGKGKGGSVKSAKNKKIVKEQSKKEFINNTKMVVQKMDGKGNKKKQQGVLDRFLPKT